LAAEDASCSSTSRIAPRISRFDAELVGDRLQFLVGRLKLFVGGLELLAGNIA
jgi:hypothetical protein